ncbi:uncharacterized protein LOC134534966 [Bacillus rossius redtenbacheri]|uniref:uncharacterized protein LOC134534966 n=1 Tax=Bacillus rossius redtenbacheri TaxID=93214 RepID=UPI002FDDAD82
MCTRRCWLQSTARAAVMWAPPPSPSTSTSLLLLLSASLLRTGSGISCYTALCVSGAPNVTDRCSFRHEPARLEDCHFDELLETLARVDAGELTPAQALRGVRDEDMVCIHVQATAEWAAGSRHVDYRACMPPDPLRCDILHNSTLRKYAAVGASVVWSCSLCSRDGCNSGDTAGELVASVASKKLRSLSLLLLPATAHWLLVT